jgi:hypothetical protein
MFRVDFSDSSSFWRAAGGRAPFDVISFFTITPSYDRSPSGEMLFGTIFITVRMPGSSVSGETRSPTRIAIFISMSRTIVSGFMLNT